MNYIEFDNYEALLASDIPFVKGDIVKCLDTNMLKVFDGENWIDLTVNDEEQAATTTSYELDKALIQQLPLYTSDDLVATISKINEKMTDHTYYLLYGKEINYFTFFRHETDEVEKDFDTLGTSVIECINSISEGKIYSIREKQLNEADVAYEFWIGYNDTITLLMLFNYDAGVVTYGE